MLAFVRTAHIAHLPAVCLENICLPLVHLLAEISANRDVPACFRCLSVQLKLRPNSRWRNIASVLFAYPFEAVDAPSFCLVDFCGAQFVGVRLVCFRLNETSKTEGVFPG